LLGLPAKVVLSGDPKTAAGERPVKLLRTALPVVFLTLCFSATAFAATSTPEINPAEGVSALALLGGAVMVFRGRRKR
jgi:hypothetical protein